EGPDEPFGGEPGDEVDGADRHTTGPVVEFKGVPRSYVDTSVPADQLTLPRFAGLGRPRKTRQVSLNEEDSAVVPDVGPRAAVLGTLHKGRGRPLEWMAPITEHVALGATEVWEIYNFTADAHP